MILPTIKQEGSVFIQILGPSPQPPPNHIQHITPIPQRNGAEQGKVTENEGFALD